MSPNRRIQNDVMKLFMDDHELKMVNDSPKEFDILFHGPEETPYCGGVWKVRVLLSDDYPFEPPTINFKNTILHPNIDENTGVVCLDVINQRWTPVFDMKNIFEIFLPQLLTYPNPKDPFNGIAAGLLLNTPDAYYEKVREYVRLYATDITLDDLSDEADIVDPIVVYDSEGEAEFDSQMD